MPTTNRVNGIRRIRRIRNGILLTIFAITSRTLYTKLWASVRPCPTSSEARPWEDRTDIPGRREQWSCRGFPESPSGSSVDPVSGFNHQVIYQTYSGASPTASPLSRRYCFISSFFWLCFLNCRIISPFATPPTFLVSAFRILTGSWKVSIMLAITGSKAEFSENTIRMISPCWILSWILPRRSFHLHLCPRPFRISSFATAVFGWRRYRRQVPSPPPRRPSGWPHGHRSPGPPTSDG